METVKGKAHTMRLMLECLMMGGRQGELRSAQASVGAGLEP
jgi:hypothetical protein